MRMCACLRVCVCVFLYLSYTILATKLTVCLFALFLLPSSFVLPLDNLFCPLDVLCWQTLYITLIDVNDNAPKFAQSFYTALPEETLAVGAVVLRITATDAVSMELYFFYIPPRGTRMYTRTHAHLRAIRHPAG